MSIDEEDDIFMVLSGQDVFDHAVCKNGLTEWNALDQDPDVPVPVHTHSHSHSVRTGHLSIQTPSTTSTLTLYCDPFVKSSESCSVCRELSNRLIVTLRDRCLKQSLQTTEGEYYINVAAIGAWYDQSNDLKVHLATDPLVFDRLVNSALESLVEIEIKVPFRFLRVCRGHHATSCSQCSDYHIIPVKKPLSSTQYLLKKKVRNSL